MSSITINPIQNVTYEVNGKVFKSEAEAQEHLDSLANLQLGLEFAEAKYPDLAPRGRQAKANCVAEYLDWIDAGKPVTEASASEEAAE